MFLACVELNTSDDRDRRLQHSRASRNASRVIELQFPHFETARIWAEQEATRHRDATGNAAVFETEGPFVSLAWEFEGKSFEHKTFEEAAHPGAHRDELVERV